MADIREIHEKVLKFLLNWREQEDNDLLFTLRRRPIDRLSSGQWFLGDENYLSFSFWTGIDGVNKTQNIYVEIDKNGGFRLRFSAKDDDDKAKVLADTALIIGGFSKVNKKDYSGNFWTKEYEGIDYLKNLELFLEEDKNRIDQLLQIQRSSNHNPAFAKSLNRLNPELFESCLEVVENYRYLRVLDSQFVDNPKTKIAERNLKIQEMTIINTGLFDKCTIGFGERATCLIGENGGGKTTLLRAAALGLVGSGSPLLDTKAAELQYLPKITLSNEDKGIQYAGRSSISVSYLFNDKIFSNSKSNVIPFNIKPDQGGVEFNEDNIQDDGFGLPTGESGMDGDGELPILVIGYPQRYGKKDDGTDIKKRSPKPNAYDILPLILNTEDNRIESLKLWISETWNQGDSHKEKVHALFSIVSSVLSKEGEEPFIVQIQSAISQRKIIVTTPFNPNGLPFDLLSTGLSNLFGWIGHLISRMHEAYPTSDSPLNESAIVLVDEIDNYLHPLVQARAVPVLLNAFPKVQFVFTSHSPVVLAALPNEGVKAYRIDRGQAIPIEHFYGRTIQDILLEEYGINKRPATVIQDEIDKMNRAIALENKTEAQTIFNRLLPILGENDPAIEDAQYDLN